MRFGFDFVEVVEPNEISKIKTSDGETHGLADLKARNRLTTLEKNRGCLFYTGVSGNPTVNNDFMDQLKLYDNAAKLRKSTGGGKRADFPLMVEYNFTSGGFKYSTPATLYYSIQSNGTINSFRIYFPVFAADRPFILTHTYDGSKHTFTKKYFTTTSE